MYVLHNYLLWNEIDRKCESDKLGQICCHNTRTFKKSCHHLFALTCPRCRIIHLIYLSSRNKSLFFMASTLLEYHTFCQKQYLKEKRKKKKKTSCNISVMTLMILEHQQTCQHSIIKYILNEI